LPRRALTSAEFSQLEDVPPETEWLANIDNPHTRRSYRIATLLILAIQAIAFFVQARQLHRSVEEMKRATAATQTAARAAESTVETMNTTARRQLRAYVAVKDAHIDKLDAGRKPEARITIRNYGQTAAYRFTVSAHSDFVIPGADLQP